MLLKNKSKSDFDKNVDLISRFVGRNNGLALVSDFGSLNHIAAAPDSTLLSAPYNLRKQELDSLRCAFKIGTGLVSETIPASFFVEDPLKAVDLMREFHRLTERVDYRATSDVAASLNYLDNLMKDPKQNSLTASDHRQNDSAAAYDFIQQFNWQGFGSLELSKELLQGQLERSNSWTDSYKATRTAMVVVIAEEMGTSIKFSAQKHFLDIINNEMPNNPTHSMVVAALAVYFKIRPSSILPEGTQEHAAVTKYEGEHFAQPQKDSAFYSEPS